MKKKSRLVMSFSVMVILLTLLGCENSLEMILPQGPKGDKGDPGKSAFELWIEFYGKDTDTPIEDFFDSLKGKDGENGEDGKSAYELWKEAVDKCDGTVKNKDGSAYDCSKNSWEDFLDWLQGGDVSSLHQYWITLPGNEGKTIEQFIEELFDCHCDGITVSILYQDDCVELYPDGTVSGTYEAQLRIGGKGGTSVVVKGQGLELNGEVADDVTPLIFNVPRSDDSLHLTIDCSLEEDLVTREVTILPLKRVKLSVAPEVTQASGEQRASVTLSFVEMPSRLTVGGQLVLSENGIVPGSGWSVTADGKIFSAIYELADTVGLFAVEVRDSEGACSIIPEAFEIPSLTPVELNEPRLTVIDNCFLRITVTGTEGMTVTVMDANNPSNSAIMVESPSGTYTFAEIPRLYSAFSILVKAEKEGYGSRQQIVVVEGANLAPVAEPLTIQTVPGQPDNMSSALIGRQFTNNTDAPLTVTVTRGANSVAGAHAHPDAPAFPQTGVIPANGTLQVYFYRDYTTTLAAGQYQLTFTTETECGLRKNYTLSVDNLQGYGYQFTLPDGWGDGAGDPDDLVTFGVTLTHGIPDSYVELQLFTGDGYSGVSRVQLDDSGFRSWNVTMTRGQLLTALANVKGFFLFFSDSGYLDKYNIGANKEEINFTF